MFGTKLFRGVGYPTPLSIPDETTCLLIQVPADPEWWALVFGVLYTLTLEWNWQQFEGGLDRDVAAAAWQVMLEAAMELSETTNACPVFPSVPTPYWDDTNGDDADDDAPPDDQPWYGEILTDGVTWVEQVGIWAITGFVAVAATPAAAIAFLPFANRFVLAFHQHTLGGIVRVLVDAVEILVVDTYGATDGVIEATVSIPSGTMGFAAFDEEDPPVLWVAMSEDVNPGVEGDPNIQVIRKRLNQAEVTPANTRWDETCDCVQQTSDGGETWTDSPTQDPRTSVLFQVPARTGGDPQCDSAQQMHDRIKNMLDAIITSSDILQAINAVVGVVSIFFFEFGIVIEAIWAIVGAIFAVGTTTLDAALTEEVYDDLLCIFYCEIAGDGTVDQARYDTIVARVNAEIDAVAAFAITSALDSIGFVGLTNAGALGEVTGDCEDCDCGWCEEFDFTISDYGGIATLYGEWESGVGWKATVVTGSVKSLIMNIPLGAEFDVRHYEAETCFTVTPSGMGTTRYVAVRHDATVLNGQSEVSTLGCAPQGNDGVWDTTNNLYFNPSGTVPGGDIIVTRARLSGFGTPPGIGVDCT